MHFFRSRGDFKHTSQTEPESHICHLVLVFANVSPPTTPPRTRPSERTISCWPPTCFYVSDTLSVWEEMANIIEELTHEEVAVFVVERNECRVKVLTTLNIVRYSCKIA